MITEYFICLRRDSTFVFNLNISILFMLKHSIPRVFLRLEVRPRSESNRESGPRWSCGTAILRYRSAMFKKSKFNNRKDKIQAISKVIEELNEKMDQIRDLKERKARISESVNNIVMHRAKQLSTIEKLEYEIQCMELGAEKINKKKLELELKEKIVERENKKAKGLRDSKTVVEKLAKMIAEAQSEVVHSPEEYQSRLDEIEEQHKLKADECSMMQKVIQEKKQSLKQMEETLNIVQKMRDDLRILGDAYKELKDEKTKLSNILKEIDPLILKESKTKLAIHKGQVDKL